MKIQLLFTLVLCAGIICKAQEIDTDFADNGIYLFDDFGVSRSSLTDFIITSENKIVALAISGNEGHILRLNENGTYDTSFNTNGDLKYVDDNDVIPVGLEVKSDGGIVVLSNEFISTKWATILNAFGTDGTVDMSFGTNGRYQNIASNDDDRYGRQIHITSVNEIIVAADYTAFSPADPDNATILKVSESGSTIFTRSFGDNIIWSASTLVGNDLFMGYWVALPSPNTTANINKFNINDQSETSLVSRNIGAGDQKFNKLNVINAHVYASNLEDRSNQLFNIRKYDQDGLIDNAFGNSGVAELNTNTFKTDNIVNSNGETFWVSVNENDGKQLLVQKVLANGQEDTNFGTDGIFTITLADFVDENRIKIDLDAAQDYLYISGTTETAPLANDGFGFITKVLVDEFLLNVEEVNVADKVVFYPNPSDGKITLNGPDKLFVSQIKIFDLGGKQIGGIDYEEDSFYLKGLEIDLSDYSKGLYYLEMNTSTGEFSKKSF